MCLRDCYGDMESRLTSLSKKKEDLSYLLEETRRANMLCESNLFHLRENWDKEEEETCDKVYKQLTNDL